MDNLSYWLKILLGFITLIGIMYKVFKHLDYRSKEQKLETIGESFNRTVAKLSSKKALEQMSGAILLRRFFDKKTEMGLGKTPYSDETINVIASSLRTLPTGNLQKILADGLTYASDLKGIDLQNTNLQNAYLGSKGESILDFTGTDFYRANLSGSSFNGSILTKVIFYQSRLINTVFKNTDLRNSNFFEANLMGANFSNANLEGANFNHAVNVSEEILKHLDENGLYCKNNKDENFINFKPKKNLKVFISKSNSLSLEQKNRYELLLTLLNKRVEIETLERIDYQPFGALGNISSQIASCSGLVLIGFEQVKIQEGEYRVNTDEHKELNGTCFSTPWNQVEAGMAAMIGLPILVLADEGISEGVFEEKLDDKLLFYSSFSRKLDSEKLVRTIDNWYDAIKK